MVVTLANEEQEAEHYVLTKDMVRPSITACSVGVHLFLFLLVVGEIAALLALVSKFCLAKISNGFLYAMNSCPNLFFVAILAISFAITLALFSKRILIGLVHVYQKYAPESRRRMCLFKPTCSEYAILALNKYGSVLGTIKTIKRLKRCKGTKYRIDYP